jgi:hypothetical protein
MIADTAYMRRLRGEWYRAIQNLDSAVTGKQFHCTFDATRNYSSPDDALARQVIHFPGDGGYTRAIVEETPDGLGLNIRLIDTTARRDRHIAWEAAAELRATCCRILWEYAKAWEGGAR